MITLERVSARKAGDASGPPSALRGVTLTWDAGVFAIVGGPRDGASLLLDVLADRVRPTSGRVLLDGASPEAAQRSVAHVPLDAMLPEVLRVDEACALAAHLRGTPALAPGDVLGRLGLAALARRKMPSLSTGEVRAVSIAIAIASGAKVLLLEEPLAMLDSASPEVVAQALRARAKEGATILVTTASLRDATRLGDQLARMTNGSLFPTTPDQAQAGISAARLHVVLVREAAGALVSALASEPAVVALEMATHGTSDHPTSAVIVSGRELASLAAAVARAVSAAKIDVEAIEPMYGVAS